MRPAKDHRNVTSHVIVKELEGLPAAFEKKLA